VGPLWGVISKAKNPDHFLTTLKPKNDIKRHKKTYGRSLKNRVSSFKYLYLLTLEKYSKNKVSA